jgi:hypothetical protein
LKVTAASSDSRITGFYLVITFTDVFGWQETRQIVVTAKDADGNFTSIIPLAGASNLKVSALELFPGRIAYAP